MNEFFAAAKEEVEALEWDAFVPTKDNYLMYVNDAVGELMNGLEGNNKALVNAATLRLARLAHKGNELWGQ